MAHKTNVVAMLLAGGQGKAGSEYSQKTLPSPQFPTAAIIES